MTFTITRTDRRGGSPEFRVLDGRQVVAVVQTFTHGRGKKVRTVRYVSLLMGMGSDPVSDLRAYLNAVLDFCESTPLPERQP